MKNEIQKILRKWEGNLRRNGSMDATRFSQVSNEIDSYIRTRKNTQVARLLTSCRDSTLSASPNNDNILRNLRHALFLLQKEINDEKRELGFDVDLGQRQRYEAISKKLYSEKLRFKGNKSLREADVTLMEGRDSRKVRRIVEKRMCQEYHRQHKHRSSYRFSGKARHEMDRAVSYQIFNLGQLDGHANQRGIGTHWKKIVDYSSGEYVMKKKVEYATLEEAQLNIELYKFAHPKDKRLMHAYYCEHCGHYHIGHDRGTETVA